jgi:hypothetical protein
MGSRFDAGDRHSDDLIAAVDRAARTVSHALAEGFGLIAKQITASTPGTPDNSAQIEATVQNIKVLIDNLHKSLPKP